MSTPSLSNTYADELPGFYAPCNAMQVDAPTLLRFNEPLAEELGLETGMDAEQLARIYAGQDLLDGSQPIAQAYAGHQFGGFVPQLGDGRALLLGEVVDRLGRRRDIALKGSGPTPFSRGGDGKAAVGPVLREYLIGEAMHALSIPTTRALAAVGTGQTVFRTQALPGAILARVAASHIRVGTFQFFAARGEHDAAKKLADYVIARHDPQLSDEPERYLKLLEAVAERQAMLIAQWMQVGFIHGVMNTDNMAISGETIDYGPCAFMESYNSQAVFSSIDTGGRYAFANQPRIAAWNLARFAETLLPLINEADPEAAVPQATEVIQAFVPRLEEHWLSGLRRKLGLDGVEEADRQLVFDWLDLLEQHHVDFTLGWRRLADAADGRDETLLTLFPEGQSVAPWLERWKARLGNDTASAAARVRNVNPIYIPRNHLVEEALAAATDHGDLLQFEKLLQVVTEPFEEREGLEAFAEPAPQDFTSCYQTFCGT